MDTFEEIAAERRGLADQVAGLSPEQQATQSLCAAWTVHDVIAHLVVPLEVSMPRFALAMLLAGGNFDRASEQLTRKVGRRPFAELVDMLRQRADSRFTPPGMGPEVPLTDVLVHGLDIRRPLGLPSETPEPRLRTALAALMSAPDAVVPKGALTDLRFEAADIDWADGTGAAVRGSADDLLLAMAGRASALDSLSGDGVPTLRQRLATR